MLGKGIYSSPYIIETAEDLNSIRNLYRGVNSYFELGNDIDLSSISYWTPIDFFEGNLDGNGYTISNMNITYSSEFVGGEIGLFGGYYAFGYNGFNVNAEVKNLKIVSSSINVNIPAYTTYATQHNIRVGLLYGNHQRYGNLKNIKVEDCEIVVTASGNFKLSSLFAVGAIAGYHTSMISCSVERTNINVHVSASSGNLYCGAMTGRQSGFSFSTGYNISASYTKDCNIYTSTSANITTYAGGISGLTANYTASNLYALNCTMSVNNPDKKNYVGGVIGYMTALNASSIGHLINSYAVSNFGDTNIRDIFPIMFITSGSSSDWRRVRNCYFESGSFEYNSGSKGPDENPIGLEISDMKDSASYSNWDFENLWSHDETLITNDGYPYIQIYDNDNSQWSLIQPSLIHLMPGSGTLDEPYIISTAQNLHDVRFNMSAGVYYEIDADINLQPFTSSWTPLGSASIGFFEAAMDGKNHTISGMNIYVPDGTFLHKQSSDGYSTGFISMIIAKTPEYVLKNLNFHSCSIIIEDFDFLDYGGSETTYAGIVVGRIEDDTSNEASSSQFHNIGIESCSINIYLPTMDTNWDYYIGGFAGYVEYINMSNCYVSASNISLYNPSSSNLDAYMGGMFGNGLGRIKYSYIRDCYLYLSGSEEFGPNEYAYIGGFSSGQNVERINDCYVVNTILEGNSTQAGFSPSLNVRRYFTDTKDTNIYFKNVYTSVEFIGNSNLIYPFVQSLTNTNGNSEYSYYESGSISTDYDGPWTGITGSLTAQMKDSSSYMTWDFENIWTQSFDYQDGYPYFRSTSSPGTVGQFIIIMPNGGEEYYFNEMIPISWSFSNG